MKPCGVALEVSQVVSQKVMLAGDCPVWQLSSALTEIACTEPCASEIKTAEYIQREESSQDV